MNNKTVLFLLVVIAKATQCSYPLTQPTEQYTVSPILSFPPGNATYNTLNTSAAVPPSLNFDNIDFNFGNAQPTALEGENATHNTLDASTSVPLGLNFDDIDFDYGSAQPTALQGENTTHNTLDTSTSVPLDLNFDDIEFDFGSTQPAALEGENDSTPICAPDSQIDLRSSGGPIRTKKRKHLSPDYYAQLTNLIEKNKEVDPKTGDIRCTLCEKPKVYTFKTKYPHSNSAAYRTHVLAHHCDAAQGIDPEQLDTFTTKHNPYVYTCNAACSDVKHPSLAAIRNHIYMTHCPVNPLRTNKKIELIAKKIKDLNPKYKLVKDDGSIICKPCRTTFKAKTKSVTNISYRNHCLSDEHLSNCEIDRDTLDDNLQRIDTTQYQCKLCTADKFKFQTKQSARGHLMTQHSSFAN